MAAKFFTGLPLDGPDPECVFGHGEEALAAPRRRRPHPPAARPLQGGQPRARPPGAHARPLPVARPRLTRPTPGVDMDLGGATWPEVEATGRTPRAGRAARAPSNSTGPTSRSTPTPASPSPWPADWPRARPDVAVAPALPYGASGEHAGFPGHPGGRPRGAGRAAGRAGAVGPGRRSPGWWWSRPTGATPKVWPWPRSGAGPKATRVLVWTAGAPGGDAHAGRTETSLMLAIDPASVRAGPGRSRAAPSRWRRSCPGCAPKGCGRYRPTACWGTPRERARPRARLLLDAMAARPGRRRRGAVARRPGLAMSPVAVVTGAARGIGAATVDRLVADGLAGRRRRPSVPTTPASTTRWPRRPTWTTLAGRHGDSVHTMVGDVRSQSDMDAAVEPAVPAFGGLDAAVAVAGVHERRAPAVGD